MNKKLMGKTANLAGANAEFQVAADYAHRGHSLAAQRWRGKAGEIDLIFKDGDQVVLLRSKRRVISLMQHDVFHPASSIAYVSRLKNI